MSTTGPEETTVAIPMYYFNGFSLGVSNADASITLQIDGQAIARLNLSFTTAKTLHKLLGELMEKLEGLTGREIMSTDVVAEALQKLAEERGNNG